MRIARLTPAASRPRNFAPAAAAASKRHLPVLMRQRARREPAGKPPDDIVAENERRQHVAPGACRLLADRQHRRQHLHRRLPGYEPQPLAQLDRAPGDAVEQRRRARVIAGPAARVDRRAASGRRREPLAQRRDLRPLAAGEDHAERIEQHQPGMRPHRLRNILAARLARRTAPIPRFAGPCRPPVMPCGTLRHARGRANPGQNVKPAPLAILNSELPLRERRRP